jgi:hypothetical protein
MTAERYETRIQAAPPVAQPPSTPLITTVIGGDVNTHARAWSPPDICQSTCATDIEEWAFAQGLDLLKPPGARHAAGPVANAIDLACVNEAAVLDDAFHKKSPTS